MQQHIAANKVKDKLRTKGFYFTLSFYGVIRDTETKHAEYRRIEIFVNGTPTHEDVVTLRLFFREIIPFQYYTIWVYNKDVKEIFMYEGWS